MKEYLMLRLAGPMQAWGGHTFEDYRPSHIFPTRSALVGLLGACLGIDRRDGSSLEALGASFQYCARLDESAHPLRKLTDFHTVLDARKADGTTNKNPVVSRREYLCDVRFTVGLDLFDGAAYDLGRLKSAIEAPVFTPFLGRRSCPLSQPLFGETVAAESLHQAMERVPPGRGILYSEIGEGSPNVMQVRDIPMARRQFGTRTVFIHAPGKECEDVSEPA